MNTKTNPAHFTRSGSIAFFFRLLLFALLGAACAFAVTRRSTAQVLPKNGPLRSAIVRDGGSPGPDAAPWISQPGGSAIWVGQGASYTPLGAEPAEYMFVTCISLVGFIAWRINQVRLGIARRDIQRCSAETHQSFKLSSDAGVRVG